MYSNAVFKGFVLFKDLKYLYVGKSAPPLRDSELCEKNKCKKCYIHVIKIYLHNNIQILFVL